MGNSIEEDIKILEELRIANENCIKNAKIKDNPFVAIWEKQNRAIEHILSDYKRVLKENEQLRTEVNSLKEDNERYQELVNENKIQDRIINKICNYICCTNYEDKIKIKEDDIVYYGEVGSIRKYFEDKIRKDK